MSNREALERWERMLGQVVRSHRLARGWSQQELADRLVARGFEGMLQTTVAKIEAGSRTLRISEFVGVANALDIPWQSLLAEQGPLLDERDPIADMEGRLASAQFLEDDALEELKSGIERLVGDYAELRAKRTALAGEYRRMGERRGAASDAAE